MESRKYRQPPKNYPREVWLGHRRYLIHYVPPTHPAVIDADKSELLGCVECRTGDIYCNINQQRSSLKDTVIHEMCHILYEYAPLPEDEEMEENVVKFCTALILELEAAGVLKVRF